MFNMVDVMIRNMDPKIWAQIKADAAAHERTLAEEVTQAFISHQVRKGTGWEMLSLPQHPGRGELTRNASKRVDEIFGKAVLDDYHRQQRPDRARD